MIILNITDKNIAERAAEVILRGGVVVSPTDTVYGMLALATNCNAVGKIFKIKSRPINKAISVFVQDAAKISMIADETVITPPVAGLLPGPYTLILPGKGNLCATLYGQDGTIGVRVVHDTLINNILNIVQAPITATSANATGSGSVMSHTAFINQMSAHNLELVDLIIKNDKNIHKKATASTVINLTSAKNTIIRPGAGQNFLGKERINTLDELASYASRFASEHLQNKNNVIVLLHGAMGAGKTTFTSCVLKNFGISYATSPTYTLENEYKVDFDQVKTIYHCDFFNISNTLDLQIIDFSTYKKPGTYAFIEWPQGAAVDVTKHLADAPNIINVYITSISETSREFTILGHNK